MTGFSKTAAFAAAMIVFSGCAASETSVSTSSTMAVNPIKSYESVSEMAEAVEWTFQIPTVLPEKYELVACYTVSGKIVSLEYSDGEREALYRTALFSEEYDDEIGISGNYTVFAKKEVVQVGDDAVTFSYDSTDTGCLALWNDEEMLYSFSGLTMAETETCILSLTEVDS